MKTKKKKLRPNKVEEQRSGEVEDILDGSLPAEYLNSFVSGIHSGMTHSQAKKHAMMTYRGD